MQWPHATSPPHTPPHSGGKPGANAEYNSSLCPESPPDISAPQPLPLHPPSTTRTDALRPFVAAATHFPAGGSGIYASPPPPPTASTLLQAFSSPPRTDIAPWRLPDAYAYPPSVPDRMIKSADPLPKKKKNRAAQAERVRKELSLDGPAAGQQQAVEAEG